MRHEEIGRFWLLFTKFGLPPEFDLVLEEMAVEVKVQIARLQTTFGLDIVKPTHDATDAEVGGGPHSNISQISRSLLPSCLATSCSLSCLVLRSGADTVVRWNSSCRFEVCIFSVRLGGVDLHIPACWESRLKDSVHEPFIFRPGPNEGGPE